MAAAKLPRVYQDVVGEPVPLQAAATPRRKVFVEQEIVGFRLDDVADADELRMLHRASSCASRSPRPQIDPANHAGDEWMLVRERQQPARLLEGLPDLNGDAGVDAGRAASRATRPPAGSRAAAAAIVSSIQPYSEAV